MRGRRPFLAFAAVLVCSTVAVAQTTGDISGRLTDMSGTPLPGATIEATSPSLPGARVSVTGEDGLYRVPSVPPGTYRLRASLAGFRSAERTCNVALGSAMNVDLTLRIEAEEHVVVSGKTPPIDTSSTTTGTNYTSEVIASLPVDRNYADIVRSNPGVSTDRGYTDGRMLALTIYGATSAENQWIIDGVNTTTVNKGTQGKAMSTEFIQEVEIKTGGYQAEYGRALGGVINAITKSGGNSFHGDGFLYYDSADTEADRKTRVEDTTLVAVRTHDSQRLDYGASLGGYLLKDRLWFFGAYNRVTVDGHISRINPSTFVSTDLQFPFGVTDNLYSGKLTWNATPSTTVVGSAFSDSSSTSGASGADPRRDEAFMLVFLPVRPEQSTWSSTRRQGGMDYALRATRLFGPNVLATFQGSYHRDRSSLTAAEEIRYTDLTCAGGTPETPCRAPAPRQANSITGGYGLIPGGDHSVSSRPQYSLALTSYSGPHEIKAGGDYMVGRSNVTVRYTGEQIVSLRNEFGQIYYVHQFFAASADDPTLIPSFPTGAQVRDYGAYLQDSWKAAPGLTLNVGLRWDGERTRNYAGETVFRDDNQWQPRIGAAWDPWRNGAAKIYAFAGRFSYALPTAAATSLFNSYTIVNSYNFDPVSIVQDPGVFRRGSVSVSTGGISVPVDVGLEGFSQDEFLVGVERLLRPGLTVGIKGTYRSLNDAIAIRNDLDYTSARNNYGSYAVINPGSDGDYARGAVPICNGLDEPANQCSATGPASPRPRRLYRGIEVLARRSLGDRLWLQASYIYSSLRGNTDGAINEGAINETSPGVTSAFYYSQMWHNAYGALALDRPHRFRLDGYWTTPWRLSIGFQTFVESGAPYNKLGYLNGNIGPAVYLVPRGSAGRLPTQWEANLQLAYPMVVGPVTVTLQGYVFNAFNNQIANTVDEVWSWSPPAGYPDTIYDPNQAQDNPTYGQVTWRSAPRSFRAGLRVAF
jgi:outer membrane receptor protein involved in Fe transport